MSGSTRSTKRVDFASLSAEVAADARTIQKERRGIESLVEAAGCNPKNGEDVVRVTNLLDELIATRQDLIGIWGLRNKATEGTPSALKLMREEERLTSRRVDLEDAVGGRFLSLIASINIASETLSSRGHLRNQVIDKIAGEAIAALGFRRLSETAAREYRNNSRKLQKAQQADSSLRIDPKETLFVFRIGKGGLIQPWIEKAGGNPESALLLKQVKYFTKAFKALLEDVEAKRREFRTNRIAALSENDARVDGSLEDVLSGSASCAKLDGLSKNPWTFGLGGKGTASGPLYLFRRTDDIGSYLVFVAVDESVKTTLERNKLDGTFTCGPRFSNLKVYDLNGEEIHLDKKEHGRAMALLNGAAGNTKPEPKSEASTTPSTTRTAHTDTPQSYTLGDAMRDQGVGQI